MTECVICGLDNPDDLVPYQDVWHCADTHTCYMDTVRTKAGQ